VNDRQGPGLPPPEAGVAAALDTRGLACDAADAEMRPSAANASQISDKTEVLASESPASIGRATVWVALHAATSEQRETSQGTEAHAAALVALRKAQPVYDALIGVPDPAAPSHDPDTFCRSLLARLQAMLGADDAEAWRAFVVWAQQTVKPPRLLHVLVALAAALDDDWPRGSSAMPRRRWP
jgi:hypothetical protein